MHLEEVKCHSKILFLASIDPVSGLQMPCNLTQASNCFSPIPPSARPTNVSNEVGNVKAFVDVVPASFLEDNGIRDSERDPEGS